jgi:nucleotide-binding universal stress UspA family protein
VANPTRILVPIDLSKRSERAIDYAADLAAAVDAELVLVTNVNLPEREVLEDYGESEGLSVADAAEAMLRRLAHEHAPNIASSVIVRFDDFPAEGILHAVAESGAEAVVMASHGRSGMSRWMLGSVAEKLARSADVPVTIVPVRDL